MEDVVALISRYFGYLLPILGCVILIVLIVVLLDVRKILKKVPASVDKVDDILANVDKSVDKLQAPLDMAIHVSKSVDDVNTALNSSVVFIAKSFIHNYEWLKDLLLSFFARKSKVNEESKDDEVETHE